jgi:hypothetical protein
MGLGVLNSGLDLLAVNVSNLANGDIITVLNDQDEMGKNALLLEEKLEELRKAFDFVVINAAPIEGHIEPVEMMKKAGISFFVFKANVSQIESVKNINLLAEEYKLENVHLFLTDVDSSVNYSGNYVNQDLNVWAILKEGIGQMVHKIKSLKK